jgi:hypothetical protein
MFSYIGVDYLYTEWFYDAEGGYVLVVYYTVMIFSLAIACLVYYRTGHQFGRST